MRCAGTLVVVCRPVAWCGVERTSGNGQEQWALASPSVGGEYSHGAQTGIVYPTVRLHQHKKPCTVAVSLDVADRDQRIGRCGMCLIWTHSLIGSCCIHTTTHTPERESQGREGGPPVRHQKEHGAERTTPSSNLLLESNARTVHIHSRFVNAASFT